MRRTSLAELIPALFVIPALAMGNYNLSFCRSATGLMNFVFRAGRSDYKPSIRWSA